MASAMEDTPSLPGSTQGSEDSSMSVDQSAFFNSNFKGDDSDSADETYYFESDHVAIRGNRDYQMMLRAVAVLEAQRIQALEDLDQLYEAQNEALENPIQFVEKLQRGVDLQLPKPLMVASLPNIHWEKYTSQLDFSSFGAHRHMTRLKRNLTDVSAADELSQADSEEVIRGRVKTEDKPETFNKLWTVEEQKQLEELLLQYPPEEVEMKRWQKIAAALGNRSAIQVQSRVQKYFIKLAKAGLPIPGRMPSMCLYKKKAGARPNRFQKYQKFYSQPSTFLHAYIPPVYMSDDDENSQSYEGSVTSNMDGWEPRDEEISDDETIAPELRETPQYQELMQLMHLRREKCHEDNLDKAEHVGFKCDGCDCEPIVGTRWHCTDCPPDVAVDFCDECVDSTYETETHNSSHRLKPKRKADTAGYQDSDYLGFIPGGTYSGYNYLDPNYMPAS